jgi:hypothetical protein
MTVGSKWKPDNDKVTVSRNYNKLKYCAMICYLTVFDWDRGKQYRVHTVSRKSQSSILSAYVEEKKPLFINIRSSCYRPEFIKYQVEVAHRLKPRSHYNARWLVKNLSLSSNWKKKSLGWAILKSLSLSSNDNFIIFVVVWTLTQFFCQLTTCV